MIIVFIIGYASHADHMHSFYTILLRTIPHEQRNIINFSLIRTLRIVCDLPMSDMCMATCSQARTNAHTKMDNNDWFETVS